MMQMPQAPKLNKKVLERRFLEYIKMRLQAEQPDPMLGGAKPSLGELPRDTLPQTGQDD